MWVKKRKYQSNNLIQKDLKRLFISKALNVWNQGRLSKKYLNYIMWLIWLYQLTLSGTIGSGYNSYIESYIGFLHFDSGLLSFTCLMKIKPYFNIILSESFFKQTLNGIAHISLHQNIAVNPKAHNSQENIRSDIE